MVHVEEPASAEVASEELKTSATTVEEAKKDQTSSIRESITEPSLASPSIDTTPAERQSFGSTNPILVDSPADTGITIPRQHGQADQTKPQPPVSHEPQALQNSATAETAKDDNSDDHRPRGLLGMLLSCCSRQ